MKFIKIILTTICIAVLSSCATTHSTIPASQHSTSNKHVISSQESTNDKISAALEGSLYMGLMLLAFI